MKYKIERLNPGRSGAGGGGLNQGKKKMGHRLEIRQNAIPPSRL